MRLRIFRKLTQPIFLMVTAITIDWRMVVMGMGKWPTPCKTENCPGRGNVRGQLVRGNMSRGKFQIPIRRSGNDIVFDVYLSNGYFVSDRRTHCRHYEHHTGTWYNSGADAA